MGLTSKLKMFWVIVGTSDGILAFCTCTLQRNGTLRRCMKLIELKCVSRAMSVNKAGVFVTRVDTFGMELR